jgi:hypothetical protein
LAGNIHEIVQFRNLSHAISTLEAVMISFELLLLVRFRSILILFTEAFSTAYEAYPKVSGLASWSENCE